MVDLVTIGDTSFSVPTAKAILASGTNQVRIFGRTHSIDRTDLARTLGAEPDARGLGTLGRDAAMTLLSDPPGDDVFDLDKVKNVQKDDLPASDVQQLASAPIHTLIPGVEAPAKLSQPEPAPPATSNTPNPPSELGDGGNTSMGGLAIALGVAIAATLAFLLGGDDD